MDDDKQIEIEIQAMVVAAEATAVTAQPVAMSQPMPYTVDELLEGDGVMLRQLTSECCRFLCCQPNIHWTIHPYWGQAANFDDLPPATMWIQEEAPYFARCCSCWAPGCRPTVCCMKLIFNDVFIVIVQCVMRSMSQTEREEWL